MSGHHLPAMHLTVPIHVHCCKHFRCLQVSAEVNSFSDPAQTKSLRKSLTTEDNIMGVLRHCFLFTGDLAFLDCCTCQYCSWPC